jgi:hypothetical protein
MCHDNDPSMPKVLSKPSILKPSAGNDISKKVTYNFDYMQYFPKVDDEIIVLKC